jgi:hypothetical protein
MSAGRRRASTSDELDDPEGWASTARSTFMETLLTHGTHQMWARSLYPVNPASAKASRCQPLPPNATFTITAFVDDKGFVMITVFGALRNSDGSAPQAGSMYHLHFTPSEAKRILKDQGRWPCRSGSTFDLQVFCCRWRRGRWDRTSLQPCRHGSPQDHTDVVIFIVVL